MPGFPSSISISSRTGSSPCSPRPTTAMLSRFGLIGRDGVVGSTVLLGIETTTLSHFVHIGGSALRVGVEGLNRAMSESPNVRAVLNGYVHAALTQSSQSAACSLKHSFQPRLARWLLTAQDLSELDELPVTQDLLARSLGVHRPTVSGTFILLRSFWHQPATVNGSQSGQKASP
jgi:hypothetical protein